MKMKKILLAAAFILMASFTFAQSDAFKADVNKLLYVSGNTTGFESAKIEFMSVIPVNKQDEFSKDFDSSIAPIIEKQKNFFFTEFTHQEVKQMVKFYETRVSGQSLSDKLPRIASKLDKLQEVVIPEIQKWQTTFLDRVQKKYLQG